MNKSENVRMLNNATRKKTEELIVSLLQSQYVQYRQVQSAHRRSGGLHKPEQLQSKAKLLRLGWLQWNGPGS